MKYIKRMRTTICLENYCCVDVDDAGRKESLCVSAQNMQTKNLIDYHILWPKTKTINIFMRTRARVRAWLRWRVHRTLTALCETGHERRRQNLIECKEK